MRHPPKKESVHQPGGRQGKSFALPQKIIIDADPGVCDALAILTALVDPSQEVIGLTATAGAVSGIHATRNLQYLTDLIDPVKHPRIGQSSHPPTGSGGDVPTRHATPGRCGLGDLVVEIPDLHNRRESEKLLVDLVREHPHEVRLLCLGPLTNVAAAGDLDPEFPELVGSIVCQAGADRESGDVTAVAEFNVWSDPEAAGAVMEWPTTKVVVPLDVSRSPVLTFDDVEQLTDLTVDSLHGETLSGLLQFALRLNRQLGCEGIPLHGVASLAVAAGAEAFSLEAVRTAVEISGELTRGMTVIDRRPVLGRQTNADLVTTIDEHGVIDYFSRSFRRAAR